MCAKVDQKVNQKMTNYNEIVASFSGHIRNEANAADPQLLSNPTASLACPHPGNLQRKDPPNSPLNDPQKDFSEEVGGASAKTHPPAIDSLVNHENRKGKKSRVCVHVAIIVLFISVLYMYMCTVVP